MAELTVTMPTIPSLSNDEASKELEGIVSDSGDYESGEIEDEVVDRWRAACSANDQRGILIEWGVPDDWLAENPVLFTSLKSRGRKINPRCTPKHEAVTALFGLPADALKPDKEARRPRLSACIEEFRIEQELRGNQKRHTNAYVNRFQAFVDLVKDKSVARLTKSDFVKCVDEVLAESNGAANKTIHDHFRPAGAVLKSACMRMPDGVFPDGLDNWLTVLDWARIAKPYKSLRKNREPMPPAVFRDLLAQADQCAKVDWEEYAESLPVPRRGEKRRITADTGTSCQGAVIPWRFSTGGHRAGIGMWCVILAAPPWACVQCFSGVWSGETEPSTADPWLDIPVLAWDFGVSYRRDAKQIILGVGTVGRRQAKERRSWVVRPGVEWRRRRLVPLVAPRAVATANSDRSADRLRGPEDGSRSVVSIAYTGLRIRGPNVNEQAHGNGKEAKQKRREFKADPGRGANHGDQDRDR